GASPAGQDCPDQSGGGVEMVAFTGSGYSSDPTQGTTFYTLDLLTGDVVGSADVGSRAGASFRNALVAPASAYNVEQFTCPTCGPPVEHPMNGIITRVYMGDLHGRLWKFLTARPN